MNLPTPAHDQPVPRSKVLLLGMIAALGSLATQLLVPALPSIADDLRIGVGSAQLVVGCFLIGLAAGQLFVGPLADRIDRRTLMLGGLLIYGLSSLAAAFAGTLAILLMARLAQAVGSSAGLVTTRVVLNSLVPPEKAVAAQASLMAVVLVSPAVAPVLGGLMTEWLGWRAIMLVLGAIAMLAALVVMRIIPKGAASTSAPHRRGVARGYRKLLGNRRFLAATGTLSFGTAALYLFLGAAPFLLEGQYHLSPRETGFCLLAVAITSIGGTRMVGLVQRLGEPLAIGTSITLAAVLFLGAASWGGNPVLPLLIGPLAAVGMMAGVNGPAALGHVLASEPGLEGSATSLAGALQMSLAALLAWLLGKYAATSALHLALAMLPLSAAALCSALWLAKTQRLHL
jgi:DHA1 family bicyclomycin/chloramphenicol resistance-like MFS transporter